MKVLSAMDVIGLEILQDVSSQMLCELFGELISDDFSRQFIYQCQLMPTRSLSLLV